MQGSYDKLSVGLEKLAHAGTDLEANGRALQVLHAALEDHFDAWLLAAKLPRGEREQIARQDWPARLERMRRFGNLRDVEARFIQRNNAIRNRVAHGDAFHLTHDEAVAYAQFVQQTIARYPVPTPHQPQQPAASGAPALIREVVDRSGSKPRLPRWITLVFVVWLVFNLCGLLRSVVAPRSTSSPVALAQPAATPVFTLAKHAAPRTTRFWMRYALDVHAAPDSWSAHIAQTVVGQAVVPTRERQRVGEVWWIAVRIGDQQGWVPEDSVTRSS
jgi:hypothetical protein